MAGVKAVTGRGERGSVTACRVPGIASTAAPEAAICTTLPRGAVAGTKIRHGMPRGGGVGRDRRAGIARGILVDRPDPDLQQMVEHHRRAAILERAGRHLAFELEADRRAVQSRVTSGVQPSPSETRGGAESGSAAR